MARMHHTKGLKLIQSTLLHVMDIMAVNIVVGVHNNLDVLLKRFLNISIGSLWEVPSIVVTIIFYTCAGVGHENCLFGTTCTVYQVLDVFELQQLV